MTVDETNSKELMEFNEEDYEHEPKDIVLHKYFLQEWKLIRSLLDEIISAGRITDISSAYKIRSIMDKYQQEGQLLEPYLESIVSPLMFIVRSKTIELGVASDEILEVIKPVSIVIYSLVTVCGYKAVIKFFPHQVSDLELAVSLLERCHDTKSGSSLRHESTGEMETKCVILLWLAILVLVPFDISSVDTSITNDNSVDELELPPLVYKLLGFCKDYLSNAGPMRSMSGLLLSRLLTRPDMPKAFTSFVEWTREVLSSVSDDAFSHFRLLGVLEALSSIFKVGGWKQLHDVVSVVWNDISALTKSTTAAYSPLLRKYLMKLTQRIGLTCLPHRSPSWHYLGGTSSLGDSVSLRTQQCNHSVDVETFNLEQRSNCLNDEVIDVPEIVEEIIEMLLSGLKDTDTVVRWSAAKGIGRITSRLTSTLSEEVLSSVSELFSPNEGDGSWHGGCLALAELARRGLLLSSSLPKVVPVVIKALHYDIRRGPHSIGSHVRDAAAYVCWAFGRAYYHTDMRSILEQLAVHLLTVACYDREVNCRRAAAAAFQENVGRQGNYPHGIDIVSTADYFSLSSRVNSYTQVAVSIAQYEDYLYPFVSELLYNKIGHWDRGLRELATEALSALVKYDPEHFATFVLEKLIPSTLSSDLYMRHGATLAAGELVLALHQCDYALPADKQKQVAGIVPGIEKARLYRGKGGEIMRSAVSRFIECISISKLLLPEKTKRSLLDTLNENLRHPNSQIQTAAVKALRHFVQTYLSAAHNNHRSITSNYLKLLNDPNVAVRRGSALAIAALPCEFLANMWRDVILKLCKSCTLEDNPEDRDAEARVNAVKGIVSVCETLTQTRKHSDDHSGEDDISLFRVIKNEVMTNLFTALDDYSVDNRGDVGSWVREAAMDGIERCTYILCKSDFNDPTQRFYRTESKHNSAMVVNDEANSLFDAQLATRVVGSIVKQAVEKMDKIREGAAKALQRILYNKTNFVPFIPFREKLEEIVPNDTELKWGVPSFSYPRFVKLLQYSPYSKFVLSGLVISIGGLQDSLRKASISALLKYLQAEETDDHREKLTREYKLCLDLLWVLQQYKRCDRVIVPSLKSIEILCSKRICLDMEAHTSTFCTGVLDALAVELKGSKDFAKLYAGIAVLGYVASITEPISTLALSHLLIFLGHRYPKIRKASAEQVYLVLLQNGNLMAEDKIEQAVEIVSETCWDGDIEAAKHRRSELYDMAGLQSPFTRTSKGASNKGYEKRLMATDENASYSSLVGSSGF